MSVPVSGTWPSGPLFSIGGLGLLVRRNVLGDVHVHRADAQRRQPHVRHLRRTLDDIGGQARCSSSWWAAAEVAVGIGILGRHLPAPKGNDGRRPPSDEGLTEPMLHAAYLMPLLPLAGFVVLAAFGRRLGDPVAGWLGTATVGGAFVVAVHHLRRSARAATAGSPGIHPDPVQLDSGGKPAGEGGPPGRPVVGDHGSVRDRDLDAHPPVLDWVHEGGPGLSEVLRLPESLRGLHAHPGPGQQPPLHLRGLGGGGAVLLLAHLLLVRTRLRRQRRAEGLPLQPAGRRGLPDRHLPRLQQDGDAQLHRHLPAMPPTIAFPPGR